MDRLWTPWRYTYIAGTSDADKSDENRDEQAKTIRCVFCHLRDGNHADDQSNFILHRAANSFIVLNLYPYASGHMLIVPNAHVADLDATANHVSNELMDLTKRCQTALRDVYRSDGFNIGINQGRAAGAGVAAHLHIHILPRWTGDANFMTTVAETRVLPEELATVYAKLRPHFSTENT